MEERDMLTRELEFRLENDFTAGEESEDISADNSFFIEEEKL